MVAIILFSSLLAVVYVGKILEALYFKPAMNPDSVVKEAPFMLLVPTWILVFANVYFGFDTDLTVGVAEQAAKALGVGGQ